MALRALHEDEAAAVAEPSAAERRFHAHRRDRYTTGTRPTAVRARAGYTVAPSLPALPAPADGARRAEPRLGARTRVALHTLLVTGVWALAMGVASRVHATGFVWKAALFGHLLALAWGFGAVVVLDFYGLGCLTRRRTPVDVARLSASIDPLIWGGFFVLMATGSLLGPHLASPLTRIKMAAVLVAGINGVNARGLRDTVKALPRSASLRELPSRLMRRLAITAFISQAAWWTAILVGFWHSPHH